MNTITTAAELDALPVGSVLLDLGPDRAEADAPVIACKAADGDWWIAGTPKDRRWRADEILRDSTGSVLICAHRPDATPEPQRVQPSVEDVAKVILSHSGSLGVHYADIANACAEAVLALFAAQPTVAGVKAEVLRDAQFEMADLLDCSGDTRWHKRLTKIIDRARAEARNGYVEAAIWAQVGAQP